ncbi:MAG: hypothetical protein GX896_10385, partial [Clostridiales bacterium]|nr:hypothetical protein [Clostridiales bacterium]
TSKLLVAFLGCFIVLILLYSGNFLVSYKTYGFGEISRQIQSIYGFVGSTLNITVKEFFVLFLVSKLFVYFAFAAIIYFVSVISKSSIGMYISLVIIFAIQSVMYYTIPQTSYLSAFGNLNIVSFLNTSSIFERYRNLNFLEEAVSCIPVFIIGTLSTIVIFSIIGVVAFSKQVSFGKSKISTSLQAIVDKLSIIKGYKTTNLFLHECYKIFIGGKVILILLAFGLSIWYFYTPLSERFESSTEAYYKHYMIKYEGALTDEKQSDIDAEAEYFDKLQMDLNKASTESNGNNYNIFMAYQEELIPFPAFQLLQQHAEYLSGTNKGEFVYDSGYKLLTGDQSAGNKDIRLALISMTMLIAGLTYVYSIEYNTGASILLRSSRNGRNKTFATKLIISVFITTAIFILTYAPYFYNVLKAYGTNGILAPANSMDHLANIPDSISIKSYLILISVSRYLIMLVAMIVIFSISKRLKSFISALVLETTVLILPLLLSLLGIKVFDYILLNPFIIANLF